MDALINNITRPNFAVNTLNCSSCDSRPIIIGITQYQWFIAVVFPRHQQAGRERKLLCVTGRWGRRIRDLRGGTYPRRGVHVHVAQPCASCVLLKPMLRSMSLPGNFGGYVYGIFSMLFLVWKRRLSLAQDD